MGKRCEQAVLLALIVGCGSPAIQSAADNESQSVRSDFEEALPELSESTTTPSTSFNASVPRVPSDAESPVPLGAEGVSCAGAAIVIAAQDGVNVASGIQLSGNAEGFDFSLKVELGSGTDGTPTINGVLTAEGDTTIPMEITLPLDGEPLPDGQFHR